MPSRIGSCVLAFSLCLAWPQALCLAQPLVAPTEALSPEEQRQKFHLPAGFEIQLVAAEPAISKPMNITFDRQGRLWVTDTLEYPYPAAEGAPLRDTVKILVDRDGNGSADEITTFADKLNIPLGVMPIPGGAVVYAIPAVMKCLDTDGDGKADQRDTLYGKFGNRDTHGMVNSFTHGLDGWLYACHGFANDSSPQGSDGQAIQMNSGNTFRMRLDGSHVEYNTHGQVNPFGLCFDPLGNLYVADCHTMPIYMLLRGAYYPSFGKPHDGLGFGPTMIGHDHKSTGIGGIAYYAAEHFPAAYRDTIFVGNPVTGRVNHDRLKSHGSTYEAVELPDFITCDDPWFRPVNLQVGPDGALYVADFYNCIIGHYEVPLTHPRRDRRRGRIWRVVYTGQGVDKAPKTAPATGPNVLAASDQELVGLLGHGNLVVRTLATHESAERGEKMKQPLVAALADASSTPQTRVHAMWALERFGGLTDAMFDKLASDSDRTVRVHAMKLLAERTWDASPLANRGLADEDPFVRRAAADALARHPHADNVVPLAKLWRETPAQDTHLVHVARMALRDQLLAPGVYDAARPLAESDPDLRARLADVSLGVKHETSAQWVLGYLQTKPDLPLPPRNIYLHHAVRYLPDAELDQAYALGFGWENLSPRESAEVVRTVGRALQERGAAAPELLTARMQNLAQGLLNSGDQGDVQAGIDLARDFRPGVFETLAKAASARAKFAPLRPAAIDVCATYDAARAVPALAEIVASAAEPVDLRQHAAAALGRIGDDASRAQLVASLQTAPERLAVAIAMALSDSVPGAQALLVTVGDGKASARLLQEKTVVERLRNRGIANLDATLGELTSKLPPADERINKLIAERRDLVLGGHAEANKGAAMFKKHCAACHRIGTEGEKIGPNLDGVGIRGVERLLEDLLDPNRNVDQAFRTTQVITADGRNLTGLALREEGNILVLADAQGKEIRVPLDEIEERVVSQLSVMPSNVADLVSEADFVHLLGYLLEQRVQAKE